MFHNEITSLTSPTGPGSTGVASSTAYSSDTFFQPSTPVMQWSFTLNPRSTSVGEVVVATSLERVLSDEIEVPASEPEVQAVSVAPEVPPLPLPATYLETTGVDIPIPQRSPAATMTTTPSVLQFNSPRLNLLTPRHYDVSPPSSYSSSGHYYVPALSLPSPSGSELTSPIREAKTIATPKEMVNTVWVENSEEFKKYCHQAARNLIKKGMSVTASQVIQQLLTEDVEVNEAGERKKLFTQVSADKYQLEITLLLKKKNIDFHMVYTASTQSIFLEEYQENSILTKPLQIRLTCKDDGSFAHPWTNKLQSPEIVFLLDDLMKSMIAAEVNPVPIKRSLADANVVVSSSASTTKRAKYTSETKAVTPTFLTSSFSGKTKCQKLALDLSDFDSLAKKLRTESFINRFKTAVVDRSTMTVVTEKEGLVECQAPKYTQYLNYSGRMLTVEVTPTPYFHKHTELAPKEGSSWIDKTGNALLYFNVKVLLEKQCVLKDVFHVPNSTYAISLRKALNIDVANLPDVEDTKSELPSFDTHCELHTVESAESKHGKPKVTVSGNTVLGIHNSFFTLFKGQKLQLVDDSKLPDEATMFRDHIPFRLINSIALDKTYYQSKIPGIQLMNKVVDSVCDGVIPQNRELRAKMVAGLQNFPLSRWHTALVEQARASDKAAFYKEELTKLIKTDPAYKAYKKSDLNALLTTSQFGHELYALHLKMVKKTDAVKIEEKGLDIKKTAFELYYGYRIYARDKEFPDVLANLAAKYFKLSGPTAPFGDFTIKSLVEKIQAASRLRVPEAEADLRRISSLLCDGIAPESGMSAFLNRGTTNNYTKPLPAETHVLYLIRTAVYEILWRGYFWEYDAAAAVAPEVDRPAVMTAFR